MIILALLVLLLCGVIAAFIIGGISGGPSD